jgi:hypothetical protein
MAGVPPVNRIGTASKIDRSRKREKPSAMVADGFE